MSPDKKTEELITRIRKKCQNRSWFGADAWMDGGFSNLPPFRTTFPEVATKEQLENIERQLGFPLPRLLRDLYLYLANGEVCFGYGILPCEELLAEYRSISECVCFDGAWGWPEPLIPLCYWGCTLYSYLDIERDVILFADTEGLFAGEGDFLIEAPSLRAWLERWITKQDQPPSFVQQAGGDGSDKGGPENTEDEEDPQAKAMGLEKLEDDPHTPVLPYVRAYRQLCRL